ncbi:hypothetical protein HY095_05545 [Candidatus Micrarchaeota archaeon]|nr:hypothetical protein [Candidatus Micrarchaeota archaeon]
MGSDEEFLKSWRLKWAEGVVTGFVRGRMDRARAFGMLRRAKAMGVTEKELNSIMQAIESSPAYLPAMSQHEKAAKVKEIREALARGEIQATGTVKG